MTYQILSISDKVVSLLYSPEIVTHFNEVDLIISCGDLPYHYLDYIVSHLNTPMFFVRGNHDLPLEHTSKGPRPAPYGGVDLHCRAVNHRGLLLAGVEGSILYNRGAFQYSQSEMWAKVLNLVPGLLYNRLVHRRYLDIFVSHAPPWQINDERDHAHQGIKAFRWLLDVFKPQYHLHGHVHLVTPRHVQSTNYKSTQVINAFGYQKIVVAQTNYGAGDV